MEINAETVELIKKKKSGDAVKIINLVKSIEKCAEENSDDPYLIAMAERAKAVQEGFEIRQQNTEEALVELLAEVEKNENRKKEQAAKGFDGLTYFVFQKLQEAGIKKADTISRNIKEAFVEHPNWKQSESPLGVLLPGSASTKRLSQGHVRQRSGEQSSRLPMHGSCADEQPPLNRRRNLLRC